MKKILFALIPCLWIATLILFFVWVPKPHAITGWWVFSTLMGAIFLSEYQSNDH